ncbi:unnamed protein product [Mytilus coruscus]|uniref:Reverse transcriptase domain-containing protein n=1 Tax=Mytilus coruscus TaxID=42192 RepID=A0A6J8CS46_MYTCO|nr:unnamed protein product [Mytilus coruscus]
MFLIVNKTNTCLRPQKDDDKPSLSIEDRRFLELMDTEMKRDDNSHNWAAPLPFKPNRKQLPNNRTTLYIGPGALTQLLGRIPLRDSTFRAEKVAVIADLQQMFYSFYVRSDHRDYLRFVWHENNDLTKELVDFRMKVHVFGNSPSPAVATCGLRKTADIAGEMSGMDVKEYIYRNFYVDDALSVHSTSEEAVSLLKRAKSALLEEGSLRLHKICSNSSKVLSAFEKDDLAKDLKKLDFDQDDELPGGVLVSVGIYVTMHLLYRVTQDENIYKERRIIDHQWTSDPLGFASPVTLAENFFSYSSSRFTDHIDEVPSSFPLVTPDEDCEVRILKTTVGKEVPFEFIDLNISPHGSVLYEPHDNFLLDNPSDATIFSPYRCATE